MLIKQTRTTYFIQCKKIKEAEDNKGRKREQEKFLIYLGVAPKLYY